MIIELIDKTHYTNLVFIHPPRTGGTSIEYQLSGKLDYRGKHESKEYYDQYLTESFVFATIRNPFDILVSKYKIGWYGSGETDKDIGEETTQVKFLHWLKMFVSKNGKINEHEKGNSLCDYIPDKIDHIIRHENREENLKELNNIFREKNIKLELDSSVKVANSYDADYRKFYNEESQEIATNFYSQDLERFNYAF